MSLPYYAIIFNNDEEVGHQFVNCGWFTSPDSITGLLKNEIIFPDEWDTIFLYGVFYTKEEVKKILEIDKMWQEKLYK